MSKPDVPDKVLVAAIGLVVLLTPAVLLGLTLAFLTYTGDVFVQDLSLLEIVELYLIELLVVAAFGYGLYRLAKRLVVHQLPSTLEDLTSDDDAAETEDDP